MASKSQVLAALLCTVAVFTLWGCSSRESAETGEDEEAPALPARPAQKLRAAAPEYKAVEGTQGAMKEATLHAEKMPSVPGTVEVRSVVLLPKKAAFTADREALYEVLRGEVEGESDGVSKRHRTGDLWVVSKGAKITMNAKGEVAVLRTISVSAK